MKSTQLSRVIDVFTTMLFYVGYVYFPGVSLVVQSVQFLYVVRCVKYTIENNGF